MLSICVFIYQLLTCYIYYYEHYTTHNISFHTIVYFTIYKWYTLYLGETVLEK